MADDWDWLEGLEIGKLFETLELVETKENRKDEIVEIVSKLDIKVEKVEVDEIVDEFDDEDLLNGQNLKFVNKHILGRILTGLKTGKFGNIIVLSGAGISTSAGIPDFRSTKTGLYDNLKDFNLPYPEAIFELDFYRKNPQPFIRLAKDLLPGKYHPTPSHMFIKALDDAKYLLRNYTQNIDDLEFTAGVREDAIIQAHGSFRAAHCIVCKRKHNSETYKDHLRRQEAMYCTTCKGLIKPCIVFFGEGLPEKFHRYSRIDFKRCDLLLIMGTSLSVYPVADLVNFCPGIPRLLLNKEMSFNFTLNASKDAAILGNLDDICKWISKRVGFIFD